MSEYTDKFWDECFSKDVPERVKKAIKRIYECYPKSCMPQGICDPMYIMNCICLELGIGDGQGHFNLPD